MATPNPSKNVAVRVIPTSNKILDFVTEGKKRIDWTILRMIYDLVICHLVYGDIESKNLLKSLRPLYDFM